MKCQPTCQKCEQSVCATYHLSKRRQTENIFLAIFSGTGHLFSCRINIHPVLQNLVIYPAAVLSAFNRYDEHPTYTIRTVAE